MKAILTLVAGVIIGYAIHSCSAGGSSTASYSESGKKIVVGTCSKEQDCFLSIGNQCEETGYKILTRDYDSEKSQRIITVQCGEPKAHSIF